MSYRSWFVVCLFVASAVTAGVAQARHPFQTTGAPSCPVGCEGAPGTPGPIGPAGPAGPQGPAGPSPAESRPCRVGHLDDGTWSIKDVIHDGSPCGRWLFYQRGTGAIAIADIDDVIGRATVKVRTVPAGTAHGVWTHLEATDRTGNTIAASNDSASCIIKFDWAAAPVALYFPMPLQ